jgi:cation diffusion facilitator CzcD-associated flavoprotein CzcO
VQRVLVVGGGTGGLALADAVDPAPDFDVAAFERRAWGELAKPY